MTQIVSDVFGRANGGLGANYTAVSTTDLFQIVSNKVNTSNLSADQIVRYNAVACPADHYAEVVLGTPTSSAPNHGYGPCVRCDTGGAFSCYRLIGGGAGYDLDGYNAGVHFDISGVITTTTFANGDIPGLLVVKNVLTVLKNRAPIAQYIDSTLAAGQWGFGFSGTDTAGGTINSFAGGIVALWPAYLRRGIAPLLRR